jgi:hypothetical protein
MFHLVCVESLRQVRLRNKGLRNCTAPVPMQSAPKLQYMVNSWSSAPHPGVLMSHTHDWDSICLQQRLHDAVLAVQVVAAC